MHELPNPETIIGQMQENMVCSVSPSDPIWNYISDFNVRNGTVTLSFDLSKRRVFSGYEAALLRDQGTGSAYAEIPSGSIHSLSIVAKGSASKSYSGDGLFLKSHVKEDEVDIDLGVLDGQTNPNEIDEHSYTCALRHIPEIEDKPKDQIPLVILKKMLPIVQDGILINREVLTQMGFAEDELFKASNELQFIIDKNDNPALNQWLCSNIALRLVYGRYDKNNDYLPNAPGVTGTFIAMDERSSKRSKLNISGLADSPLFFVYQSGHVQPFYASINNGFDRKTTLLIRSLIQDGVCKDASEAIAHLAKTGYYAESFKSKMNNEGGSVAVCNGDRWFDETARANLPITIGTSGLMAVVALTDGLMNPYVDYKGKVNTRKVLVFIQKLILNESLDGIISAIERDEKQFYLDKKQLPTREKESDDKLAVVLRLTKTGTIKRIIEQNGLHM